jgi:hypothetical protein
MTFKAAGYLPRDSTGRLAETLNMETRLQWLQYTAEISACQEGLKVPAGRGVWRSSPRRRCRPKRRTSWAALLSLLQIGGNSHSFPVRRHTRPFLAVTYPPPSLDAGGFRFLGTGGLALLKLPVFRRALCRGAT